MTLLDSLRTVATASGDGTVDWEAAARAAKASTEAGSVALDAEERTAFARDVRDAAHGIRAATGLRFPTPETIEVQSRHHWIDANSATFRRLLEPLDDRDVTLPGIARRANTATMAGLLAFAARHVLGQYDPLLLAEDESPGLYFVRPNLLRIAGELEIPPARFRRWIAVHEVTHAAEFGAAPWLASELEDRARAAVGSLADGRFDRERIRDLDAAMTAVEGYAEYAMEQALDGSYSDVRRKIDRHRRDRGPVAILLSHLLGLERKRRQYERGKAFFASVANDGRVEPTIVWAKPTNLPTVDEIDEPQQWIDRMAG
ncbi:MAG: zinc-dependent metalloprotease [Halobacteriales archaeon]